MSKLDWIVLSFTLTAIITYGLYKSRTSKNLEGYFLSNRSMPWYLVLLSIMGTQASAITFLSAPGQAFTDGMRFVQYYFGIPIAMAASRLMINTETVMALSLATAFRRRPSLQFQ